MSEGQRACRPTAEKKNPPTYDYIIVGGGSAGCVLANRLSADPGTRVLLLEAGRPERWWDLLIQMPSAALLTIGNRFYDWCYESDPEPHMGGRRISLSRGKIVGGSSSINGMVFQRGNPLDYDGWAEATGSERWDFGHCLPYFKRLETAPGGPSAWRGGYGALEIERSPGSNPIAGAFLEAAVEAGYSISDDLNGSLQEGFATMDRTVHRGRRMSAARAYLLPVKHRPNLEVQSRAFVGRVIIKGGRATGVDYARFGDRRCRARGNTVILCGGAINTPQLLQLSGLGDETHLRQFGIEVVERLPGVGENLQDHLEVYVQHASRRPVSLSPALKLRNRPAIGMEWMLRRSGVGASNHLEVGGFVRTHESIPYPNLMFHFVPVAVDLGGSIPVEHGYQAHITPVLSDARGRVRIKSNDPRVHPSILFNFLSTEQDRREWVDSIRICRRILSESALAEFDDGELAPGEEISSEADILAWVGSRGETSLHTSCTCKMGKDETSVVDPADMKVHGVDGLHVVDASIMPKITNANTYAPVMMIAEKAADLIAGNTPLPPQYP